MVNPRLDCVTVRITTNELEQLIDRLADGLKNLGGRAERLHRVQRIEYLERIREENVREKYSALPVSPETWYEPKLDEIDEPEA